MTPETGEVSTQEVAPNDTTEVLETNQQELSPTGEEATSEAEAVPEPLKPEEDPRFASKFQVLARRDRKQREERETLKQERERVARDAHHFEQAREFNTLVKTDPLKALELYGITEQDLVDSIVGVKQKPPEEDPLHADVRTIKEEIANYKKQQEEAAQRAQQEQYDKYFKSIYNTIDDDTTDRFELIKETGRHELAGDIALDYWKQHGETLLPEQAAEAAENYLIEEAQKVLRATKLKKLGKPKEAAKEAPKESPTLTNDMRNAPPGGGNERLSDEERLKRAAAMIRWKD